MVKIKKIYSVLIIAAILTMVTFYVSAASAASEDAIGPGLPPDPGDCIPDGNPDIRPEETPGVGPAPSNGDCDSTAVGFK